MRKQRNNLSLLSFVVLPAYDCSSSLPASSSSSPPLLYSWESERERSSPREQVARRRRRRGGEGCRTGHLLGLFVGDTERGGLMWEWVREQGSTLQAPALKTSATTHQRAHKPAAGLAFAGAAIVALQTKRGEKKAGNLSAPFSLPVPPGLPFSLAPARPPGPACSFYKTFPLGLDPHTDMF